MNVRLSLAAVSLVLVACGSGAPDDEVVVDTAQAVKDPCAVVRCMDGYVPKRRGNTCACEPSACTTIAMCAPGYAWSDARCRCVKTSGESCGTVTCPAGQVCCNASCGICTPPDGACIQIACGDAL